jgi:hypothetical protein
MLLTRSSPLTKGYGDLEAGAYVGYHRFDALIITAMLDELEAVLAFGEGGKDAWTKERDPDGFPFHHRELPREGGGEPLCIAAASFDEMGGNVTGRTVSTSTTTGSSSPGAIRTGTGPRNSFTTSRRTISRRHGGWTPPISRERWDGPPNS